MRLSRSARRACLVAAVSSAGLLACGDETQTTETTQEVENDAPRTDTERDIRTFLDAITVEIDFDIYVTPADHARRADLIVVGKLVGIREGRAVDFGSGVVGRRLTLEITPSEFLKGSLPDGSDGILYVELLAPSQDDAIARAQELLPDGVNVQAYLVHATSGENQRFVEGATGRPDGQPLWHPLLGSGFVFSDDRGVVVPYAEVWSDTGLTLEDFAPEREANPPLPDGSPFPISPEDADAQADAESTG